MAMVRVVTDNQFKGLGFCPEDSGPGFKQGSKRAQIHVFLGLLCCIVKDGLEQEARGSGTRGELGWESN